MSLNDCRNVEIKAQIINYQEFVEKLNIASEIADKCEPIILIQRDVFFNTLRGRLKLRHQLDSTTSQLVHYERCDIPGPKLSIYNVMEVQDGKLLEKMLTNSIGLVGILEKIRNLFMCGRTRIHLDIVNNSYFALEFEVKLEPEEDVEVGKQIAEDLMKKFRISKDRLLKSSYFDILFP
ncbi:uncharacterized protein [Chironomus tepperi]|uniref:uncharacterized protein n=1 Tax=Chironomus tepperi TaxID=113505 RepID=UPI00391F9099